MPIVEYFKERIYFPPSSGRRYLALQIKMNALIALPSDASVAFGHQKTMISFQFMSAMDLEADGLTKHDFLERTISLVSILFPPLNTFVNALSIRMRHRLQL